MRLGIIRSKRSRKPTTPDKAPSSWLAIAACGLMVVGAAVCALAYPIASQRSDSQVMAQAASLPDYSKKIPPIPWAVGHPERIDVPSVGISLPVIDGTYDASTKTWQVSNEEALFDASSTLPNSHSGNTFMYGHATNHVFGPLLKIQPDALAIVTTDTGFVFTYKLTSHEVVDPTNTAVLNYSGPSRLMLQTCTGPTLSEYRQLFYFSYVSHSRSL